MAAKNTLPGISGGGNNDLIDLLGAGLPDKVMPTKFYILQQGRDSLFMRKTHFGSHCRLTSAQEKLVARIMRMNSPDQPGTISFVIWESVMTTTRLVRWIDHTGDSTKEIPVEQFQASIRDWFYQPRG